jgi:hypothetical protein
MLPHTNPQMDARMRFRLRIQVEKVRKLCDSERLCRYVSHFPSEVRHYQQTCPYGWTVAGTTVENLFRKYKIDWDSEDEEKTESGFERGKTRQITSFWAQYLKPPADPIPPRPWWQDPRMYG